MKLARRISLSILLLQIAVVAAGQSKTSSIQTPAKNSLEAPMTIIDFKADDSLPMVPAEIGAWDYPMKCGSGDRYFINLLLPPEFLITQLSSISETKGIVRYSIKSARDLHNVTEKYYFPVESGVVFLVTATQSNRKGKYTIRKPDGSEEERATYAGEYHDYLAKFDADGIYRGIVEIDKALTVTSIGMFDSGTYLALGMTTSDRTNHLALLDSDGTLLRLIDPPRALEKIAEDEAKVVPGIGQFGLTPWAQFLNFRRKILVIPHSRGTVLEVSPGGEVRVITLKIPVGLAIDSFLPSAEHWYARIGQRIQMGVEQDLKKTRLYEFDPESGSILRQLKSENANVSDIACEQGGEFVAFHWDERGQLKAMRGTIH